MHKIAVVVSGAITILSPSIVFAAPKTFSELVAFLIGYINIIIPIIISAAVLLYVRNTASGLWGMREGKADPSWKTGMMWGVITIFFMVSIWGILTILLNTVGFPIPR